MALKIAILGTRGVPANYGGFETFAQELSTRLVRRGYPVSVYGRNHYIDAGLTEFEGVNIVRLPSIRSKYLETVSHTLLSILHAVLQDYDAILICNAINSFMSWIPRLRGQPVILNVDGIERHRKKWNRLGKGFYRVNEFLATLFPSEIVTDAKTIKQYYKTEYRCNSRFIPYGTPVKKAKGSEILETLDLRPRGYLLYVSRLEPENNAHLVIKAYLKAKLEIPLVIVGDAPYGRQYINELKELAAQGNVVMPGAIYGDGYWELLSHALCYFHGTEVGGTHPALLEAMGAGSLIISHETPENREVLADTGLMCSFNDIDQLGSMIKDILENLGEVEGLREKARSRVRVSYDWERVTDQYEELFNELTK